MWATFLSLRRIASITGGEIIRENEDIDRLNAVMRKALKSYTGQSIDFPVFMRFDENRGTVRMGYMELRTGSGRDETIRRLSFFNFSGKWELQGRICIKPKNLMVLLEVFENSGLQYVKGIETVPGFENRFDVMSANNEAALEVLNLDLQEALMNSLKCYPFNSLNKNLVLLYIDRESLLITGELVTGYDKYDSLYKTGNSLAGIVGAVLEADGAVYKSFPGSNDNPAA